MTQSPALDAPLTLPCGATLPNRLAKAAMTEGLANPQGEPTEALQRLYAPWADRGCGLLISGNVIVDGDHLERPGNVIVAPGAGPGLDAGLRAWAASVTGRGTHLWAQISHAGRQTQKAVNPAPKAPSAVPLGLPGGQFAVPQAMSDIEIEATLDAFAAAAARVVAAGFTGVQVHAAHGYLLSSFLNPRANQRTDRFGGSLENRARPLLEAVRRTRAAVGPGVPVSVKLNSSDFQKGGMTGDESLIVARMLEGEGIDLLEISGGNYEAPEMMGMDGLEPADRPARKASTVAREAYFLEFATALRGAVRTPLMLTGGLRTRAGMLAALAEGVDVVGVARPLAGDPLCVQRLLSGQTDTLPRFEDQLQNRPGLFGPRSPVPLIRTLYGFAGIYWSYAQFLRMGRGEPVDPGLGALKAMGEVQGAAGRWLKARRAAGAG